VPPKSKPPTIELPAALADEIATAARKTHRSVAFIVARALAAGKDATILPLVGDLTPLVLTSDEDDPPRALASVHKASSGAIAAAWTATRARFAAWIQREEEAQAAERAEDLDAGLRDAADATCAPARLVELARSEYVRVRALVARHPAAPAEALARLAADPDRVVREALAARA
jgi:hypothetical protein